MTTATIDMLVTAIDLELGHRELGDRFMVSALNYMREAVKNSGMKPVGPNGSFYMQFRVSDHPLASDPDELRPLGATVTP